MRKTIAVMGGTGRLGLPVAFRLKEDGFRVRVLTRDGQKAGRIFDDSFEIAVGDPSDALFLEEALRGCYGVHISLPTEAERTAAEAVSRIAAGGGVNRISYLSGATVAEENRWLPMINRKFLAERAIRESGVPFTFFCPTWFMESLPLFVAQGRAAVFGRQPWPYHWIAAEDFAGMVSLAFSLPEAANRRFRVMGPEAIRMQDALRRYCAALRPEIKKVTSMPFWLVKLLATLTGNQKLKGVGELMAYFEKVGEGRGCEAEPILGRPRLTLDDWLRKAKRVGTGHKENRK